MENIFTISKVADNDLDDDVPNSLNIDDLYESKRTQDLAQLRLFNRLLKRVHSKIQITSRQKNADQICWFVVPEIMLGIPMYDQGSCIAYMMDKLKSDGFRVQYMHPNTLMILWNHWVPNYVIHELKEKTGRIFDNQGNDLTPAPPALEMGYGSEKDPNTTATASTTGTGRSNVVLNNKAGTFQRTTPKKSASRTFTPISEYKPAGNMVYDELMFDTRKRST